MPSVWVTFGALAIVISLILGMAALWRRHGPAASSGIPTEAVHILGKRAVDQRHSIYLVRLGSRLLLLGSSAQGLQTLTEVTDPVEVDLLAGMCRRSDGDQGMVQAFAQLFSRSSPSTSAPAARRRPQEPFSSEGFSLQTASAADREEMHG